MMSGSYLHARMSEKNQGNFQIFLMDFVFNFDATSDKIDYTNRAFLHRRIAEILLGSFLNYFHQKTTAVLLWSRALYFIQSWYS